jgi:predicted O-methyltransferase YrrM
MPARTTTSPSPQAGTLLYTLARTIRPQTIVEFGTSYGISTPYLAAAVTDNGYTGLPAREPGSWLAGARTGGQAG